MTTFKNGRWLLSKNGRRYTSWLLSKNGKRSTPWLLSKNGRRPIPFHPHFATNFYIQLIRGRLLNVDQLAETVLLRYGSSKNIEFSHFLTRTSHRLKILKIWKKRRVLFFAIHATTAWTSEGAKPFIRCGFPVAFEQAMARSDRLRFAEVFLIETDFFREVNFSKIWPKNRSPCHDPYENNYQVNICLYR